MSGVGYEVKRKKEEKQSEDLQHRPSLGPLTPTALAHVVAASHDIAPRPGGEIASAIRRGLAPVNPGVAAKLS